MTVPYAFNRIVPRTSSSFLASNEPKQTRVLVVDDEETLRVALSRFLRSRNFYVVAEESGAAALARLSQEKFDIMLCDVRMPEMTGLDVLPHALRLDSDLAVLMLTGVNDAHTATEALSHEEVKPFFEQLERDHQFTVLTNHLALFGLCHNCRP